MLSLVSQTIRALAMRYVEWRQRQQAYAELSQLDDRALADIGISRSEILSVIAPARVARAQRWSHAKTASPAL